MPRFLQVCFERIARKKAESADSAGWLMPFSSARADGSRADVDVDPRA
jgi:hypothetical protein